MSRMFRVISGGHESPPEPAGAGADPFAGNVPFVEVGGPEGVVSSTGGKPHVAPRPAAVERAVVAPPVAPPAPPILHPAPVAEKDTASHHLSVTFHRVPKVGLRLMQSGVVPEVVAYHFPDHPISGEYRKVRDEIVKQYDEPGPRVTLFTAAQLAAGTTTVLVNFAVSLAQEYGSRVLLVDANFARPGVARRLGGNESPGLAEVLNQSIPLAWALQPTPVTNLHVLAAGTPTDHTEGAMAADFPRLLGQLRQWFDWVVVDAGVWHEMAASEATCGAADGVYLVARQDDADRPEFAGVRAEAAGGGGHVRGYVSTRQ